MSEILAYALKLLAGREYTVERLSKKLRARFGEASDEIISQLVHKRLVDDRRFAENFVARRTHRGIGRLREGLLQNGVSLALAEEVLSKTDWPSLTQALNAKMNDWNLRYPLQPREAARLFRALARLGYDEDAIREEIQQLHDQQ